MLIVIAAASWYIAGRRSSVADYVTVYYTKDDGSSEVPWRLTMPPARPGETSAARLQDAAFYATEQAVAGPPPSVAAIRFPTGTRVLSVAVTGSTAVVDLSHVKQQPGGALSESGQFKSLVWSLTALPGIDAVAIRVGGAKLATLPGGNLELDEPLRRSDW